MTLVLIKQDIGRKKTGAASSGLMRPPYNNPQLSPPKLTTDYPSEVGILYLVAWEYGI